MESKSRVLKWEAYIQATLLTFPHPKPSAAKIMAQMDLESGGVIDAHSNTGAVGLMQIIPDRIDGTGPSWLRQRPTKEVLLEPAINISFAVYLMVDAMHRASALGFKDPYERALIEYYTGDMRGDNKVFGGISGTDYVTSVKENISKYNQSMWERFMERFNGTL